MPGVLVREKMNDSYKSNRQNLVQSQANSHHNNIRNLSKLKRPPGYRR